MKKETLIDLLEDISQVDIGWNFEFLRQRAKSMLKSINEAPVEALNVSNNEKQKEFCHHAYITLTGTIEACQKCSAIKITFTK